MSEGYGLLSAPDAPVPGAAPSKPSNGWWGADASQQQLGAPKKRPQQNGGPPAEHQGDDVEDDDEPDKKEAQVDGHSKLMSMLKELPEGPHREALSNLRDELMRERQNAEMTLQPHLDEAVSVIRKAELPKSTLKMLDQAKPNLVIAFGNAISKYQRENEELRQKMSQPPAAAQKRPRVISSSSKQLEPKSKQRKQNDPFDGL